MSNTIEQEYHNPKPIQIQSLNQQIAELICKSLEENNTTKNNKEAMMWIKEHTNIAM